MLMKIKSLYFIGQPNLQKIPDIVELLLNQKDVDINCLDNFEENALDYAKVNEHGLGESITNLLIEKGVVEAPVKTSRTSHEYETIKNILDMLPSESKEVTSQFENLLIDESVKLEKIVEVALLYAITNSNLKIVNRLIETGVAKCHGKKESMHFT